MTDPETGDLSLPLVAMNAMGKDHVPALIDEYIALGAESIASDSVDEATANAVALQTKEYKVGLVVSDDLKGGWTNRWASEFSHRFETKAFHKRGSSPGFSGPASRRRHHRSRRRVDVNLSERIPADASRRRRR